MAGVSKSRLRWPALQCILPHRILRMCISRKEIWEWSSSVLKWLFNAASGAATPPWSPTTSTSVALHLPWREHNSTACHLSWPRSEASPKSRCHFSSTRQLREPSASTMYTTEYHPSQNHQPMIMRQQSPQKGIGHFVHYPASLVFQLDGTLILYSI